MAPVARAHFIGIGGSGMAGIALVAHRRGIKVSGSDLKQSSYVQALLREGVAVSFGHDKAALHDSEIDVVVVSTAIPESNPEYAEARRLGMRIWKRARMLAYLGEGLGVLAVSGTHGKTTTSALLATSLVRLGADPTFLVGGVVEGFSASSYAGTGPHYVVEADESDGSFVWLRPRLSIVTNIESDHLDYYEGLDEIKESFAAFLDRLTDDGLAIVCADSPGLVELTRASGKPFYSYGLSVSADVRCRVKGVREFDVVYADGACCPHVLGSAPGVHNMLNATAVACALDWLGYDRAASAEAISAFAGVGRRFERVGTAAGVDVVDDYGHHPTEIDATLQAARRLGYRRVHVVFQPHRYTRTRAFMEEFASAFGSADTITLLDVYSAGEEPIPGINSEALARAIRAHDASADVACVASRHELPDRVAALARPGEAVVTMGAGDVTELAPLLLAALERVGAGGDTPSALEAS
ncbi:MAG: UDP-N-acetylmuramate--L-alanine ligase [Coriobacteriales bacterium]|nr:UDP-N-acetylmuramate--L-alanine ligase [Coriobacteriales bacterium]